MKVIRMVPEVIELPGHAYSFVQAVMPKLPIAEEWGREAAIATMKQKEWPIKTVCKAAGITGKELRKHYGIREPPTYHYYTIEDELLAELIENERKEMERLREQGRIHYATAQGWRDKAERFLRLSFWQRLVFLFKGDI